VSMSPSAVGTDWVAVGSTQDFKSVQRVSSGSCCCLLTVELTHSFLPSPDDTGMNHGTKVLTSLIKPWANTDRLVVVDSYFASVQAAKRLMCSTPFSTAFLEHCLVLNKCLTGLTMSWDSLMSRTPLRHQSVTNHSHQRTFTTYRN
jgi:hypothetical protein